MPPRVVSLALAGRRLTAPPEAYGPKKQQQIKGWLKAVPTSSFDLTPEPGVQDLKVADAELEELYREVDRRESIDGTLRPVIDGTIKVTDTPGQRHSAGASTSTTASNLAQPGQGGGASPGPRPAGSVGELSLTPDSGPDDRPPSPSPYPNVPPQRLPKPGTTPQQQPSQQQQQQRPPSPITTSPLRPTGLDVGSDGLARPEELQALELAASMLLARVDAAGGPAGPGPRGAAAASGPEVDRYKRALMLALLDKQRLQEAVKAELAEVRALAATAQQEAAQKLETARADLAAYERRATGAEAELSRVRAEAMRQQNESKTQKLEVDDREDEYKALIAKLQGEAQAMMARLKEQGLSLETTVKKALEEADAARQQAGRAERQRRQQHHEFELLKARLEMELATTRAELSQKAADLARAERDKAAALEGWEKEAAARFLAEESEKKALQAATKQLELAESHQQARAANEAIKQHAALAARRSALLRAADPLAATVGAPQGDQQQGAAAAASKRPASASAVQGKAPGSPPQGPQQPQRSPPRRAMSPSKAAARAAAGPSQRPGAVDPEPFMLQQLRVEQHTALQRAVASEKVGLTEAVRVQRRALLAAQLGEAKQVEEALAAAPEYLRCMGIAFRGYLLGDVKAGSLGAAVSQALSGRYRLIVDPVLQGPAVPDSLQATSSHLVRLCATLVVFAVPGLLAHPLARAAVSEAAQHGCPVHIVAPSTLSSVAALTGESAGADAGQGIAAAPTALSETATTWLSAAWDKRVTVDKNGQPAHLSDALANRLGLPDEALRSLPVETLKRMAVDKTGCMPELVHLNCPRVTSLRVQLAGRARGAAEANEGSGGGAAVEGGSSSNGGGQQQQQQQQQLQQQQQQQRGLSLEHLLALLRGNTTITSLSIHGCSSLDQARALADALVASPSSAVASLTLGAELPLGPLLGRGERGVLAAMDLSHASGFGPEDAAVLCAALRGGGGQALTELSLPGAAALSPRFRGRPAVSVLRELVAALVALPALRRVNGVDLTGLPTRLAEGVLDLAGLTLGPVAAGIIFARAAAAAPGGGTGLQGLNLTGCALGVEGAEQLPVLPGSLVALQRACLADNALAGAAGAAAAVLALAKAATSLRVLDLSLNALEDAGIKELAQRLPEMSNLLVLALANNGIKAPGAKALASALPSLQQLQDLHLSGNFLGDPGVAALSDALGALPALRRLYLQQNYSIAGDGARAIAAALAASTSLEELHMSRNSVGADGGRQLAQGLAASPSLRHVDLGSCKLRVEGVQHIAGALAANTTLTTLCLERNSMGDRGVKLLVEALERNATLLHLELQVNSISLVGCRLLSTLLRDRNTTLRRLAIGGNDADDMVLQALEELASLQRHTARAPRMVFPPSRSATSLGPQDEAAVIGQHPTSASAKGPTGGGTPDARPAAAWASAGGARFAHASAAAERSAGQASRSSPPGEGGRHTGVSAAGPALMEESSYTSPSKLAAGKAGLRSPANGKGGMPAAEEADDLEALLDRYRRPQEEGSILQPSGHLTQHTETRAFSYGYTGMS